MMHHLKQHNKNFTSIGEASLFNEASPRQKRRRREDFQHVLGGAEKCSTRFERFHA